MFDDVLREKLKLARTIAIVGAKDKPGQPVDRVGRYLLERGFIVYPIHPVRKNVWGLPTFKSIEEMALHLKEKGEEVDIICLFRASEYCFAHAKETITAGLKPKLFWLQEGIVSRETGEYIFSQHIAYVEDLCIKTEYERLLPYEFDCTRCSICCEGEKGIIVDNEKDLPRLLDFFQCSLEELDDKYTHIYNGKRFIRDKENFCLFFEEGKGCGVHPVRPDICRAWPYFKGNILDEISFEMAKKDCKGIISKARHKNFQQEGLKYLQEHKLIKESSYTSAANALKYTKEQLDSLEGKL